MDIMKNIESLIESDISGPMIESATGVSRMTISNYRNKKSDFKKMTLEKAIKLNDYWLSQPGSFTDDNKDDSQKLKEITAELKDMIERLEGNANS